LSAPLPLAGGPHSLFLDFDGTLVDFAATPDGVQPEPALRALLERLLDRLDGAVAIITGRRIASIDALLAPLRLPVAGLQGLERRSADGVIHRPAAPAAWLVPLRTRLRAHVESHPGLLLEDKEFSLAVHYRAAPRHEAVTRRWLQSLLTDWPEDARLLEGNCVFELRPGSSDKGTALEMFMAEVPFAGRRPIYLGDDDADLPAMRAARDRRGMAIAVGPRITALQRLKDPAAVRDWLEALAARCTTGALAAARR
jgi:trehalose 6-phosphate phosphatase